MTFDWDDRKRAATLRDRGLDFGDADLFFDGRPIINIPSPRGGEDRQKTTAIFGGVYYTLVWVLRGEVIRVISMRRAHEDEEKAHKALHD